MPELIEADLYRVALDGAVGRRIVSVELDTPSYLRFGPSDGSAAAAMLVGETIVAVRRHGKVVVVEFSSGLTLAARFGMTGRVIVDGVAPIEALEYGPKRDDRRWDRAVLRCDGGGVVRFNDPRKLGSLELDADLSRLGPDAATISTEALAEALRTTMAVKAALLDQSRVAGLGNLLGDDALYRAGLAPTRRSCDLSDAETEALAEAIRRSISELSDRGGSHRGDLQPQRHRDGRCPLDGARLSRAAVGGRTTYWCPHHQR